MRIVVIGKEEMARNLSARYGVPFFIVSGDMDLDLLEQLCAAPGWIAVAEAAPDQEQLLSRADAVMICMDARLKRLFQRLLKQPFSLPDPSPEQIACLKQMCPRVVMTYGSKAALRYPEVEGLSDGADFV